jgi:geranylgeranyl reductase family protein
MDDVIIVGAGPAGCIAAYHLASAGLSVRLLEKARFLRRKVCGGGLTHRAWQELPFDISPIIDRKVLAGEICFMGCAAGRIGAARPIAYLVQRRQFDAFLLAQALARGAHFEEAQNLQSIHQDQDTVTAYAGTDSFRARFLIGADGVHSRTARAAGLIPESRTSLAYEALLTFPEEEKTARSTTITFDFGTLFWGYGWIFPKSDHLNVGVFRAWPGRKAGKRQLMRFIRQHPDLRNAIVKDIRAFPIPLGGRARDLHRGRVLLAGDAAQLADPWLGEGLYFALASGRMAAEAILEEIHHTPPDLQTYSRTVNEILVRQLAYARRLSVLIHLFPLFNVAFLSRSPTLQGLIIALLRGDQSHQEVWQYLKGRFPELILKVLLGK